MVTVIVVFLVNTRDGPPPRTRHRGLDAEKQLQFPTLFTNVICLFFPVVIRSPDSASVCLAGTCLTVTFRVPLLSMERSARSYVTVSGTPELSVILFTADVYVPGATWAKG